jgi:hypothetical protein
MKHDLTTGTWQDDTGCPISIILVSTSDEHQKTSLVEYCLVHHNIFCVTHSPFAFRDISYHSPFAFRDIAIRDIAPHSPLVLSLPIWISFHLCLGYHSSHHSYRILPEYYLRPEYGI